MTAASATAAPLATSSSTTRCCAHCGAPATARRHAGAGDEERRMAEPAGGRDAASWQAPVAPPPWYCCSGCQTVAEALAQAGLSDWYQLAGEERAPARTTGRSYEELDDPCFAAEHVTVGADGLASTQLYLEDLRCTACVWLVERLPQLEAGVVEARVDLGRGLTELRFDPRRVSLSRVGRALDRLGHPAHPYRTVDRDAQRRREDRALLVRIGVAGVAAGNVMLLAVALYAGWFGGAMTEGEQAFLRWTSMAVALPLLSYAALPFARTALAALRARRLHLDLPITVGILVGLGVSTAHTVAGVGELYFDSVAMLVFLLLVARFLQTRHQRRASVAAEMLLALTPRRVHLLREDGAGVVQGVSDVPIEAVTCGQLLDIYPGETVPLDGVVERGVTTIDRSLLTGESRPARVGVGDALYAGTLNLTAAVRLRATATGERTRIGQLVGRIAELTRRRAPVQRLIDRVAGRFTLVVGGTAAATLLACAATGRLVDGVERALALLVVTCPCALALATPLAISVTLARAARRGILIKGADALELLARPGTLVLDKTGTITQGEQRVASWHGDAEVAALASAVEAESRHPVARALRAYAAPAQVAFAQRIEKLGSGVSATIVDGDAAKVGAKVTVGSPRWTAGMAAIAAPVERWIEGARARGESPVVVAVDGRAVAVAGLADPPRPDAALAIAAIRALGWQIELLSGDDEATVRRVGAQLGLAAAQCRGAATPEAKTSRIEELTADMRARRLGAVVMVGDGVNDAGALAAASCGVATHGSAEASIEAADVYVSRAGVAQLVTLLEGARATMQTLRRNLRLSLVYNLAAGGLAVAGAIHPLIAAVLMPLSSLTVLVSSLRSRAMREPRPIAGPSLSSAAPPVVGTELGAHP
jgi:P-type Cu2+ transporter